MSSEVDICNRALSRVGSTKLIEALTQQASVEAAQCNLWYSRLRDELLASFAWPFATARATLTAVDGESRTNWGYVYALPSDSLQVLYLVLAGVRRPQVEQRIPFVIESMRDSTGKAWKKVLLSDLAMAEAVYTARIEDPEQFDELFEDALSWRIAVELAYSIVKDPKLAQYAQQQYRASLHAAAANAANEVQDDPDPVSTFESCRS
jgi:hypothetical protein